MQLKKYNKNKAFFTAELMRWNSTDNKREMPWKNEKDPYKIWISEIILQQTRVQQGLEYYNRFITKFPSVKHIANADESSVFKLWEGLGYYSRCKNIIASAKYITEELQGKFPENFEDIIQLKGVGSYTASAIASFAYNKPYAVLDGNVFRVLARFFGINTAIDGKQKNEFASLANEIIDKQNAGIYNQAIMDFGATICKPQIPLCNICPLQKKCFAFLNNMVNALPVKEKSIKQTSRWLYYLLINYKNKLYVKKRTQKDIWQNLYEFVLIETRKAISIEDLQNFDDFKNIFQLNEFTVFSTSKIYKQKLTHQTINGQFFKIKVNADLRLNGYDLLSLKQINKLPFPKFITAYLKD